MYLNSFCSAVIVAAGTGKRLNSKVCKQFIELNGKPIIVHTMEKFQKLKCIDEIILVTKEEFMDFCRKDIVDKFNLSKVKKVVKGGEERQFSVYNGLVSVNKNTDIVVIHDGVRPFADDDLIEKTILEAKKSKACISAVKTKDTIKKADAFGFVSETLERNFLYNVQTPQAFNYDMILKAYEKAFNENFTATDDSMIVENYGNAVKIVEGSCFNIKITTAEDLILAKYIFDYKNC